MQKLYKITALLLCFTILSGAFGVQKASAASWYDTHWGYRKSHTIVAATGAGTNYQIPITVNYGSGTDSTNNVYLGGKGKTDFSDLFFTASDGVTPIPYWIQTFATSSTATVWIKVPDDISSSNATIYIYYGNASATSASNGVNTFILFDDFNGTTIDSSKWTQEALNGSMSESGGVLSIAGGNTSSPYGWSSLGSSPSYTGFADNSIMTSAENAVNSIGEIAFRGNFAGNTGYKGRFDARAGEGHSFLDPPYVVNAWGFINSADGAAPTPGVFNFYEIKAVGSTMTMYVNGSQVSTATDATYPGPGEVSLQNHYGPNTNYDWVAVRKLVATEPTNGAWTAEETAPVGGVPTRTMRLFEGFKIKFISGKIKLLQR